MHWVKRAFWDSFQCVLDKFAINYVMRQLAYKGLPSDLVRSGQQYFACGRKMARPLVSNSLMLHTEKMSLTFDAL